MVIGFRMVKVGTEYYPARRTAELSPDECATALPAVALGATIEALRLAGGDDSDLREEATTAYSAFVATLVPAAPPEVVAALDYDELARIVGTVIAAEAS